MNLALQDTGSQQNIATTWAMANMNMIIHDMQGQIEIGDSYEVAPQGAVLLTWLSTFELNVVRAMASRSFLKAASSLL